MAPVANYATVEDMGRLWRPMTADEITRANALLPVVCSTLRIEAKRLGYNLDGMVNADQDYANVAKQVTVDIVARVLMTSTNQEPMTQMSQAAGGYSVSGTFLSPGGGLYIKREELRRLGLRKQRMGAMNLYG